MIRYPGPKFETSLRGAQPITFLTCYPPPSSGIVVTGASRCSSIRRHRDEATFKAPAQGDGPVL
ncbi:MAG: hypothetical protein RLP15_12885, partial [Cryomorphaceae bacterium]